MGHRIKKFNELTGELQKTIKEAKEKLLNAILEDDEISKVEKLQLIADNGLFRTDSCICDPFYDTYHKEYVDQLNKGHSDNYDDHWCIDSYFGSRGYDRHQIVDLSDVLTYINYEDNDLITIYTNRTNREVFKISKYEFIDTIYDWCVKNKIIAFEIDW